MNIHSNFFFKNFESGGVFSDVHLISCSLINKLYPMSVAKDNKILNKTSIPFPLKVILHGFVSLQSLILL